ncbi:EF-hand domain-containing protein [Sedimentitalea todarodis]|uniref:EF-hand domain-containing protein n=1 Tax=Sedimentitalea todarodis TaxID=1631240 RepID=A0ABU3VE76_9RHOB|nr:hypothetical protein [Sedimentitalea todarodis]MDU9004477.1 hypothetical protein [Sedimentitalea todarodis]
MRLRYGMLYVSAVAVTALTAVPTTVLSDARHSMLENNSGDGKPFPDMIEQLLRVPMAVDADGDGVLSGDEILRAGERLLTLDDNGDGKLNGVEMGAYEEVLPLIRWHRITNLLDRDGDIRLSAEEIAGATESLAILDRNHDFKIDESELSMRRLGLPVFARPMGLDFEEWLGLPSNLLKLRSAAICSTVFWQPSSGCAHRRFQHEDVSTKI